MDSATEAFLAHRHLLFTVAYELLGSAAASGPAAPSSSAASPAAGLFGTLPGETGRASRRSIRAATTSVR
jgi:hypothetical protein